MIAKVVVNISSSNIDQFFDYIIPNDYLSFLKIGSRVIVPFGNGDKTIMGFVLDIVQESNNNNLKEISTVVDYEPILSKKDIELAIYIKNDTVCPLIRILNLMIPDALQLKSEKYLTVVDYSKLDPRLIDLFAKSNKIKYNSQLKSYDYLIAKYVKLGLIKVTYDTKQVTNDKMVKKYLLNPLFAMQNRLSLRSNRQRDFIDNLHDEIALSSKELIDKYDVSASMINSLYKKGFLSEIQEKETRVKIRNIPFEKRIKNSNDELVINLLEKYKIVDKPILFIPNTIKQLFSCILQLVNINVENGKNVVIFVPEILNTYQIDNFIRKETSLSVGVINSTMSYGEILDIYNEIKNDTYSVIVTSSKGALFPFKNIGCYILLNSDSDNYYNDQSPRYDLHKVFDFIAKRDHSKVVRVSFTPTISEYTYALKGYFELVEDVENENIPFVEVVDLKDDLKKGSNSYISTKLIDEIRLSHNNQKKCLLIVNNKSYSSYIYCRNCGETLKCDKCGISLQYHKKNNLFVCPSCGNRRTNENKCPNCQNESLRFGGIGIEQALEELNNIFTNYKIKSLINNDFNSFLDIQEDIYEDNIDILITTSLYASSLMINELGLIALLNVDSVLKASDYDATYRTYNLLSQMGRLCLDKENAKLLVQTYYPQEECLVKYLKGNYHDFIKSEIVIRKILKNEPFYFVNRLIVKGKYETIFKDAQNIKKMMNEHFYEDFYVLGPTYNYVYGGVQLIIKHKIKDISEFYQKIYQKYQSTTTTIIIDKYPKYL